MSSHVGQSKHMSIPALLECVLLRRVISLLAAQTGHYMAEKRNPWLPEPKESADQSQVVTKTSVDDAPPEITGATAPQASVPPPDTVHRLPTANYGTDAELWWLGVHGGSGESSLAALADEWKEADHCWPVSSGAARTNVVLVARMNLHGLQAAQHAAQQWASGHTAEAIEVHGLVLVADSPGSPPKPIRQYAEVIAGGLPRIWWIPWVEAWRADPPTMANAPRRARKLVRDLEKIIHEA